MRWFKDEKTEARLQDAGLSFTFEQVKLDDIDEKSSLHNNARIIGATVDDDVVVSYAMKMEERNAAFPPIVLKRGKTKYIIIDGNHRFQAYQLAEIDDKPKQIDCYVVDGSEMAIEIATRSFNAANGLGQSHQEKLLHIRHLLRQPGADKTAICSAFGIKREVINREERIWKTDQMVHDAGLRNHGLTRTHLMELSKVADNQNVLKRVAVAATEYNMTGDRIKSMVDHVKAKRTERTRIEAVAEFCSGEVKPLSTSRQSTAPNRDKCIKLLNTVRIFFSQHPTAEHCHLTAQSDLLQARCLYEEVREKGDVIFGVKSDGNCQASNGTTKRKLAKRKRAS